MRTTDQPFPEAISQLLQEREWSIRELHRQTHDKTGWGAMSTIHFMVRGDMDPSPEGIEAIASALNIDPRYFAEYRLAKVREGLDPRVVGFRAALKALGGTIPKAKLRS